MRITKIHVQNYRSIINGEAFEIDKNKTILVGPNEAGKTALLQAIQHLNPPSGVKPLSALRDYPRSRYSKITTGEVDPAETKVVEAEFELDDDERALLPEGMKDASYVLWRNLDNSTGHRLKGAPDRKTFADIDKDLLRLAAHVDHQFATVEGSTDSKPSEKLNAITADWKSWNQIEGDKAKALSGWLDTMLPFVDEDNKKEEARYDSLKTAIGIGDARDDAVQALRERVPVFVLFSNYFRVRPLIHL